MPAPVYLSINEFDGDGVTTQHEFAFAGGYIDRTHVKAYIIDALGGITPVPVTDGMFVTDSTLDLGVAAPIGGVTRIYRETPRNEPLLDFTDGARITAANLDLLARQTVLGVAEAFDAGAYAAVNDLLGAAGAAVAAAEAALAATVDAADSAAASAVTAADQAALAAADRAATAISALASADSADLAATAQAAAEAAALASASAAAAELEKLGYVYVTDFLTPTELADVQAGTASINVLPKVQAAFAAGKRIFVPDGRYYLGAPTSTVNLINLAGLGDGITIHAGKNVEWVVHTTSAGSAIPRIFNLFQNNRFHADHMFFRETNFDQTLQRGAIAFHVENGSSLWNGGDITIDGITSKNCMAAFMCSGASAPSANRVRGVHIGLVDCDDGYYGVVCANDLDGLTVDRINSRANYRPYFVYSAKDHDINLLHREGKPSTGAVNIANYGNGSLPTRGIKVRYGSHDNATGFNHVLINHIGGVASGGLITGIDLELDITGPVAYTPLSFINYTGSGGSPTAASSNNKVYDVTVKGSCDAQALPIAITASYGGVGRLNFTPGDGIALPQAVRDKFLSNHGIVPYSAAWLGATTNPALGNGTLTAKSTISGSTCTAAIELVIGSTTTMGSGSWTFGLPYPAAGLGVGSAVILRSGVNFYTGNTEALPGASAMSLYMGVAGNTAGPTVPFTWAVGDRIRMAITYPV